VAHAQALPAIALKHDVPATMNSQEYVPRQHVRTHDKHKLRVLQRKPKLPAQNRHTIRLIVRFVLYVAVSHREKYGLHWSNL
jgi:hypothetical protein